MKKLNLRYGFSLLLVVGIVVLFYGMVITANLNRGWKEDWVCNHWDYLTVEDNITGDGCYPQECTPIKTNENTEVEECICKTRNEDGEVISTPFKVICDTQYKVRTYSWDSWR